MSKLSKPWKPSEFALRIEKIAKENGDVISEDTLEQFDEAWNTPTGDLMLENIVLNTIKGIINLCGKLYEAASPTIETMLPYVNKLVALGGVILKLINFRKPDPVVTALAELKVEIAKLSDKMTAEFEDLKKFIVENDFYQTYVTTINAMFMYMNDTMTDRRQNAVDIFREAYEKHAPMDLVYRMLAMLKNEATNPLLWEMKTSEWKRKSLFNKWAGILRGVVMQSLTLEAFSAGILLKNDTYKVEKIIEKAASLEDLIKQWYADYETLSVSMDKLKKHVEGIMDDEKIVGEEGKLEKTSEFVEDLISKYRYAVFCRDGASPDEKVYHWNNNQLNSFSIRKSSIEIIIYRSTATTPIETLEQQVTPHINGTFSCAFFFTNNDLDEYMQGKMDKIVSHFGPGMILVSYEKPICLKCTPCDEKSRYIGHLPGSLHVNFWLTNADFPIHHYVVH